MSELIEALKTWLSNPTVIIVGAVTLIEIVPIKINPWRWIFTKIGNLLTGDIRKEIKEVKDELKAVKDETRDYKVQNWRWNVLDFANSCRNGRRHSHDEWRHTISQLAEYENYIEANNITNGVFEEDARYLRTEYQEHCAKNDFL